ncbi:MAG: hypothetical protein Q8O48_03405 [Anaerolineales bacterium]|nr:hypothetical protein [Anaerolineales bacterium]
MSKNKKLGDYWKNNLTFGIQRTWEWLGVRGIIIDVVISLIAGLLIAQNTENRLNVAQTAGVTIVIALGIYILLVLISVIFIVPYQENLRLEKIIANYKKKGKEPPELQKLAELRTEGVELRNFGAGLTDSNVLSKWINDYTVWDKTVIKTLGKLSKAQAGWFTTLDRMPLHAFRNVINGEHSRYLNIFEEKLKRLDTVLRSYLNLS